MSDRTRVLFLCTGNSCRSQMAEAWLRYHGWRTFKAFSAGTEPKPIHPLTYEAMLERGGVSLDGQRSKKLDEYLGRQDFDYVVTVCDSAAQACPAVWPGAHAVLHWSFEDPAEATGTHEQRLAKFRKVRDQIEAAVLGFIREHSGEAHIPRAEEIEI